MDEREMNALGFNPDDLLNFDDAEQFDPQGGVTGEKNPFGRGVFNGGKGKSAVFSLILKNRTAAPVWMEIFNSERSIVKVPNDSIYSLNAETYRPFTAAAIRDFISVISTQASYAAVAAKQTPACAVINDNNGDLVYLASKTQVNINANPLTGNSDLTGIDAFVKCGQVPYSSFLDDINSGLVLHVKRIRIKTNNLDQFDNTIDMKRFKSFGGADSNTLEYQTYRDPKNNLTDTVDVVEPFYVDRKTGLFMLVEANTQVNLNFRVDMFRNNGISWR